MDIKKQLKNLPRTSGVYLFRDAKCEILYIGKAVNLRNRVRSHFNNPKLWLSQVARVETQPTHSEITALILESQLIKKHRPPYNVQWKDDKNYFYVAITHETFPRVFITHQPESSQFLKTKNYKPKVVSTFVSLSAGIGEPLKTDRIGPFVDGNALKSTLRVLRKIFPFRSCHIMPKHSCLQYHLGRCLAPCLFQCKRQNVKCKTTAQKRKDQLLAREYRRNINIMLKILRGQQTAIIKRLKNTMTQASQKQNFEQAAKIRDQITGLEKVLAHSQIIKPSLSRDVLKTKNYLPAEALAKVDQLKTIWHGRVEAYDISNISGELAVGSMIVFENGRPKKSDYRRFKIKTVYGANDIAMIKEVLQRRFKHHEWPWPDTILIDGGQAQLNAANKILKTKNYKLKTDIYSLAKKQEKLYNKNQPPIHLAKLKPEVGFLIQRIRNEAHRFALNYHRQLRKKQLL